MPGTPALHGRRSLVGWSSLRVSQHQIVSLDRIPCTLRLPLIRFTTLPKANTQHFATRRFLVGLIREGAEKIGGSLQRLRRIASAPFVQSAPHLLAITAASLSVWRIQLDSVLCLLTFAAFSN